MLRVHLENGRVTVEQAPMPERPEGYALLRLLLAGICNTDLELERGYYGFAGTPGHDSWPKWWRPTRALAGKRVVGEINLACTAANGAAKAWAGTVPTADSL